MTPDLRIQQAVAVSDARGVRVVAQSAGFDTPEAERVAVLFGTRPAGVPCPDAVFACPFGKGLVAVVQVADRPGARLGFRFLLLAAELYKHLGDPFAVADRYPPNWACDWPARRPRVAARGVARAHARATRRHPEGTATGSSCSAARRR
jgi:hypothetical protein